MTVDTKSEFYRLYHAGHFGPHFRTWDRIDEVPDGTRVNVRSKLRAGMFRYGLTKEEAREHVQGLTDYALNEPAPDDLLLIQGEVCYTIEGLALFYSTEKTTMRKAMQMGIQVYRLVAQALLKKFLWPASYDDLLELFERFPDSVIEFGAYNCQIGDWTGRNTVFWEVRNY